MCINPKLRAGKNKYASNADADRLKARHNEDDVGKMSYVEILWE